MWLYEDFCRCYCLVYLTHKGKNINREVTNSFNLIFIVDIYGLVQDKGRTDLKTTLLHKLQ